MNLTYNLLWVENEREWIESVYDDIREFVEDKGFVFNAKIIEHDTDSIDYNLYDLILMDLNLSTGPTGDVIIDNIRNNSIYTDVVFYSADGIAKIRQKGSDRSLEGVYYSGRQVEYFIPKVQSVISNTIKKVQDLNNLRGLVMTGVSELDSIMDEIILKYFKDSEMLARFHQKITKDKEKSIHKMLVAETLLCNKECSLNWKTESIENLVQIIDSSQKARAVNIVIEYLRVKGVSPYKNMERNDFYNKYLPEIINKRNKLAHCSSSFENGKEVLKTREGNETFTSDDFANIRRDILRYHGLFEELLKL